MAKKKRGILMRMVTDHEGGISSKIIIGSLSFMAFVVSFLVMAFVNPEFPNLDDIIIALITMSAAMLGLTTLENYSYSKHRPKGHKKHPIDLEPDDDEPEETLE